MPATPLPGRPSASTSSPLTRGPSGGTPSSEGSWAPWSAGGSWRSSWGRRDGGGWRSP